MDDCLTSLGFQFRGSRHLGHGARHTTKIGQTHLRVHRIRWDKIKGSDLVHDMTPRQEQGLLHLLVQKRVDDEIKK